jgi:putative DNA primase/helicase
MIDSFVDDDLRVESDDSAGFRDFRRNSTPKAEWPRDFKMTPKGLFYHDPIPDKNDEIKPPFFICGPLEVLAKSRNGETGDFWGILLRWIDPDGRPHEWAMPRTMLASDGAEIQRVLFDRGLDAATGPKARGLLVRCLASVRTNERANAVATTGWCGAAYVLPDGTIGHENGDRVILQTTGVVDHAYNVKGTFRGWQNDVARLAVGNSRLILGISTALAATLLEPCGEESGGFHLRGLSSIGKTTALHVAGSVWGGGDRGGFVRPWRATANGLEAVAALHNDALLCLDELSQLHGREAGEVAYMLANGAGKSRATRDASLRKPAKWRLLFLSTGEIGLADKVAEDLRGRRFTAGQQVRVVDVPADTGSSFGLFEELHGFADAGQFAKHLQAAVRANYGHAARVFIDAIAPHLDKATTSVKGIIKDFTTNDVPAGADGQVHRVAARFALVAAAGEIAAGLKIVPWEAGEASKAAKTCFDAWLEARGGVEPAEVRDGINAVKAFLSAHGTSRFLAAWEDNADAARIPHLVGFRKKTIDGSVEYFVTAEAWPEVAAGFDPKSLAKILADRGLLIVPERELGKHNTVSKTIPGVGKRRVYHVSAGILGEED